MGSYLIVFLSYLFFLMKDIGDSISHTIDKNLEDITEVLADTSVDLFAWFKNNGVKANVEKVHIVVIWKDKVFTKIRLYDIQ